MPKLNREGRALALSRDQLEAVFEELRQPHRAIAQICYYTASRVGEIVSLKREAIIGNTLVIKQHKTRQVKEVRIQGALKEVLKGINSTGAFLFPGGRGRSGKHISVRAFEKALQQVYDLLGIRGASTHSFRRSMATHLYRQDVDLESIRQLTGHKSLESLTLYIDIVRDEANQKIASAIADPNFGVF